MVHTAPVTALIAQMLLLAGLAIAVGLSGVGLSPAPGPSESPAG